mmetsp:Transcript_7348/g.10835  ORF Transcript_7348/g.10835 Transcript_7348/m.10835 type:complete len:121 (-) Transcript_7348:485-847(-)
MNEKNEEGNRVGAIVAYSLLVAISILMIGLFAFTTYEKMKTVQQLWGNMDSSTRSEAHMEYKLKKLKEMQNTLKESMKEYRRLKKETTNADMMKTTEKSEELPEAKMVSSTDDDYLLMDL